MPQQPILIGNWKMNLGPSQAADFAVQLRSRLPHLTHSQVWVAPPAISLTGVLRELDGSPIRVGAQDVHWATSGAFTGETSPQFLCECGAHFSLVGHSERRTLFGETSERVAKRMKAAITAGLHVVVCIGETENERAAGATEQVIQDQLAPVFEELSAEYADKVILAYEPVWAIGTGKVASLEEIAASHRFIDSLWRGQGYPLSPTILYGGSVSPQNFPGIIALPDVHGALVGGASIKHDQWLELIAISEATATHNASFRNE